VLSWHRVQADEEVAAAQRHEKAAKWPLSSTAMSDSKAEAREYAATANRRLPWAARSTMSAKGGSLIAGGGESERNLGVFIASTLRIGTSPVVIAITCR
jgi:hypothetical protein